MTVTCEKRTVAEKDDYLVDILADLGAGPVGSRFCPKNL
jgi:hypothetical protein